MLGAFGVGIRVDADAQQLLGLAWGKHHRGRIDRLVGGRVKEGVVDIAAEGRLCGAVDGAHPHADWVIRSVHGTGRFLQLQLEGEVVIGR